MFTRRVNQTPPDVYLPDCGLFKPDLVLIDEQGALLFVEDERDTDKIIEQRQAKWRIFYQASGGKMFVVCDNRSCMHNISGEINNCLGNRSLVEDVSWEAWVIQHLPSVMPECNLQEPSVPAAGKP
ncbi:MAG: hypothetical protein A2136_03240 [Chloroflexi bacterium RBG_16_54_11]|nr:MAG: hypothetical protein A2136_03240 [Chloroflexi bacterium RBG_16_54_11]